MEVKIINFLILGLLILLNNLMKMTLYYNLGWSSDLYRFFYLIKKNFLQNLKLNLSVAV